MKYLLVVDGKRGEKWVQGRFKLKTKHHEGNVHEPWVHWDTITRLSLILSVEFSSFQSFYFHWLRLLILNIRNYIR